MGRSRAALARIVVVLVAVVVVASCSSDDGASDDDAGEGPTPDAPSFTGRAPDEIVRPAEEGDGIVLPQPAVALPDGYVREEVFVGGTATSFEAADTPDDGQWTATPVDEAPYRTRVLIHRPPAEAFSGTVVVEWFNVSALESAPVWTFVAEEIGRAGHAYVGVSAQAQGVEGGDALLDVDVDEETAAGLDAVIDSRGLTNIDPVRYGSLAHPGDAYAFDIFGQVGRAAADGEGDLLGGLEPVQVVAAGQSQSAAFLSTLINAVHPLAPVFDGFLVHSRGAGVAPLHGDVAGAREDADQLDIVTGGVRVRTDLDVPVFIFEAETDLTLLGYASARQPDTDLVRTWEVAGTAHSDAWMIRSVVGGPRDGGVGSVLGCEAPVNAGPHPEVLRAALAHLVAWVAGGDPPPAGERIELADGDDVVIARDEDGIALGGVRTPLVDVPVATLTGDPPGGGTIEELREGGGLCFLFGETIDFDRATLLERYGTADGHVEAFRTSADAAVDAGFLLRADADAMVAEAEADRERFE